MAFERLAGRFLDRQLDKHEVSKVTLRSLPIHIDPQSLRDIVFCQATAGVGLRRKNSKAGVGQQSFKARPRRRRRGVLGGRGEMGEGREGRGKLYQLQTIRIY